MEARDRGLWCSFLALILSILPGVGDSSFFHSSSANFAKSQGPHFQGVSYHQENHRDVARGNPFFADRAIKLSVRSRDAKKSSFNKFLLKDGFSVSISFKSERAANPFIVRTIPFLLYSVSNKSPPA